jgi:hypothetical protein
MRKGLKGLLVGLRHFRLDVVEEKREGATAQLRHLVQLPLQRSNLEIGTFKIVQHDHQKCLRGDIFVTIRYIIRHNTQ